MFSSLYSYCMGSSLSRQRWRVQLGIPWKRTTEGSRPAGSMWLRSSNMAGSPWGYEQEPHHQRECYLVNFMLTKLFAPFLFRYFFCFCQQKGDLASHPLNNLGSFTSYNHKFHKLQHMIGLFPCQVSVNSIFHLSCRISSMVMLVFDCRIRRGYAWVSVMIKSDQPFRCREIQVGLHWCWINLMKNLDLGYVWFNWMLLSWNFEAICPGKCYLHWFL